MRLSCVVIDDEDDVISEITEYIEKTGYFDIIHSFSEPFSALQFIKKHGHLDFAFIDVDMPGINGIDLSTLIRPNVTSLFLCTSHSRYALNAFEVEADDFLLKPFNFTKFQKAVDRSLKKNFDKRINQNLPEYLFVKNKEDNLKLIKVKIAEIIAVESSLNYVKIHLLKGKVVTHMSLKEANELLSVHHIFLQLHRSFIINMEQIISIEGNNLEMLGGMKFTIGENYREGLNNFLINKILKPIQKK